MSDNNKILVGKIVAAQGIRGEVRVQTYTQSPLDFKSMIVRSNRFADGDLTFVRLLNPTSSVIVAKIAGVATRNDAEAFRNTDLFVLRDSLPKLGDGEFYQTDLIGFSVIHNGTVIGLVDGFQNFGAGDILELDNGDLVSFADVRVSPDEKRIFVV